MAEHVRLDFRVSGTTFSAFSDGSVPFGFTDVLLGGLVVFVVLIFSIVCVTVVSIYVYIFFIIIELTLFFVCGLDFLYLFLYTKLMF